MMYGTVPVTYFVGCPGDDRRVDVLFGAGNRFVQRQSLGQEGRYGRGERAARAVRVLGVSSRMERRGVASSVSAL